VYGLLSIYCLLLCLFAITYAHTSPPDNSAYARYAVRGGIAFLLNASVHWLWLRVWLWVWEWVC